MDDFEQQLRRQALATPPENWRAEILETARQSRTSLQPVTERMETATLVRSENAMSDVAVNSAGVGALPEGKLSVTETLPAPAGDRLQTGPTLLARFREWLWPHPAAWGSAGADTLGWANEVAQAPWR